MRSTYRRVRTTQPTAVEHPLRSQSSVSAGRQHVVLTLALLTLAVLLPVGCGPSPEQLAAVDYSPLHAEGWEVSTPAERGLDPGLIAQACYNAAELDTLYSLLIVKDGFLVAEKYFNEGSVDQKDRLQSATKSYTSALVGIALEQGYLSSVDQKMLEFFPEIADTVTDPRKEEITLRQMLQMRTGYPSEETDAALWQGLLSGVYAPLIEEFPLVADPGTEFNYSNLTSNWLGIIVDRVSGMSLKAFGEAHLFPLVDTEAGEWGQDAEGHNNGCGDLQLTPRNAAKFGLMYLDEGMYDGKQVVPADWVRDSLKTYSVNEAFVKKVGKLREIGYGYQWWSANAGERHVNFAWGHGGQLIVLVDDLDMVVVTTSYPFWLEHNDESWKNEKAIMTMVSNFVDSLPAG